MLEIQDFSITEVKEPTRKDGTFQQPIIANHRKKEKKLPKTRRDKKRGTHLGLGDRTGEAPKRGEGGEGEFEGRGGGGEGRGKPPKGDAELRGPGPDGPISLPNPDPGDAMREIPNASSREARRASSGFLSTVSAARVRAPSKRC